MVIELIEKQFVELSSLFPSLEINNDKTVITGSLSFEIEGYIDSFDIEITIPEDYPKVLPNVQETSNRIPRIDKYHINPGGTLCLGSRRKIREIFSKEPTLLGFVTKILLPFFYSFCYLIENGVLPYGELSHGSQGLIEDYKEFLNLNNKKEVLDFLKYMLLHPFYQKTQKNFNIRTRNLCLCGSKLRFSKCHKKYNYLADYYSKKEIEKDIEEIAKL